MYRQDALYAALLALVDDFEREAATATAEPPAAAAADCELGAAALADDLTLLRVTLERCAATASSGALEAARAARDRLAKREKKAKARQKKAVVAAVERPEVAGCRGAPSTEKAGATRAEPALPSGAPGGAVHDFMTRRAPADDADDSEDEETTAALAAAAEARARRRAEGEG